MATWVIPNSNNQSLNSVKELVKVENSRVVFFIPSPDTVATTTFWCTSMPHPLDTTWVNVICSIALFFNRL
ncbi:MAG: hypothetical protein LBU84_05520 [Prevotella sp.]|nr:hypothetical protein [Prevotella sp.]